MNSRIVSVLCAAASLFALSACESGSVKQTLGLTRNSPDEFRVLPRPSLAVPPQFGLRPPGVASEEGNGAGEMPTSKQAESLVLGTSGKNGDTFTMETTKGKKPAAATKSGGSSAESQFLQNAGATKADPNVRATLTEEKAAIEEPEEEKSWWNVWPDEKKEPIVQPSKETERLQKNKAENKPVTEGETPELKTKDRGVIGKILGD
ncbi:MAG: DUF3035 domain-containing protein [Alphaproteobacteria bacterium]|nr:DUF3035 domain-containing protein [Alphaproteobacteria bacterium]